MDDNDDTPRTLVHYSSRRDPRLPLKERRPEEEVNETNAANRRAYVTASRFASQTSTAKVTKRLDAMSLLQTMALSRHAQGVTGGSASSPFASPLLPPPHSSAPLGVRDVMTPIADIVASVSSPLAPRRSVVPFGSWRSNPHMSVDVHLIADHALPLSHSEFRFKGQSMFIDKKRIPRSGDASRSLELMGGTRLCTTREALTAVHGAIAAMRNRRVAADGGAHLAIVPDGAVRLGEEAVRRCVASRGWHAALAVAFSLATGRSVLRSDGSDAGHHGRVWQRADACLGGLQEHAGHELLHRMMFSKTHTQRQLRVHAEMHNLSHGNAEPWLDVKRVRHMAATAGDWRSALACAAQCLPWVCPEGSGTPRDAQAMSSLVLAALHSAPVPASAFVFSATVMKPFASPSFQPMIAPLHVPWVEALLALGRSIAAVGTTREKHHRRVWEWLCVPPTGDSSVSVAVQRNAAAVLDVVALGGAPLPQVQRVADILTSGALEFNMKNTHLWASYARACGLHPDTVDGGWAAALQLLSSNAAAHDVAPTAAMYEAAMFASLISHRSRQRSSWLGGPGWHSALRLLSRCEGHGLPVSQCMLGMAISAQLVGARLRMESSKSADPSRDATDSVRSCRDAIDGLMLPELSVETRAPHSAQPTLAPWRHLLTSTPGRAPPHADLVIGIAASDSVLARDFDWKSLVLDKTSKAPGKNTTTTAAASGGDDLTPSADSLFDD